MGISAWMRSNRKKSLFRRVTLFDKELEAWEMGDDWSQGYKLSNGLEIAPVRNLDDFLLSSARFQVPQFNDTNRWANRIICNLLYYQTNYGILALALFLIISLIYPRDLMIGTVCIGMALFIFFYFNTSVESVVNFKQEYPYVGLGLILIGAFAVFQMISSLMVFMFAIAFPLLAVLTHASLRLRNMKNKVANKAEASGVIKTVMGYLLDLLGMKVDRRIE